MSGVTFQKNVKFIKVWFLSVNLERINNIMNVKIIFILSALTSSYNYLYTM